MTLRLGSLSSQSIACYAGSIFGQIRVALNDPTRIPSVAGAALPASSNFFVRPRLQPQTVAVRMLRRRGVYLCRIADSCIHGIRSQDA